MEYSQADIDALNHFITLAKKGEIRIIAASKATLEHELSAGNECTLIVWDKLIETDEEI